jgi:hypothetical protein
MPTYLSSTMAETPLPPAPVLSMLLSDRTIVLTLNHNIALIILQGVLSTRARIPPTGKWADLERLLFEPNPPAQGPFHGRFKCWADSQRSRNVKDRVVALLNHHGVYNPMVVSNPSMLQTISRTIKAKMDTAEALTLRRASLEAEHLRIEARGRKNVHQEGAMGTLPRGYGIDALRVAWADKAYHRQNQDASSLLTQNPRLQNNHFRPIVVESGPPRPHAHAGVGRTGTVMTPLPVCTEDGGDIRVQGQQALPPQLPTLNEFVAAAVPPPDPNAGAGLPAAPGEGGAANDVACIAAAVAQRFIVNAAMVGVGQPIVVDEADAAAMRWPCCIDNTEVIDGINCAIMASTTMIGKAIKAKGAMALAWVAMATATTGGTSVTRTLDAKLESLQKQRKLAIDVGDQMSITHCKQMIRMLEEREMRAMEGGN